jgi:glycosyltransferase involved in cell wall biosynthesis
VLTCRYDLAIIRKITRAAHRGGSVTLLMSDSWAGVSPRNPVREMIKAAVLRRLYDGAIVSGIHSWNYLRKFGFRAETLWTGVDVVDNEHFRSSSDTHDVSTVSARPQLDLPNKYFLVPGRHAPEKNLVRFMHAFSAYRREGGSWSAVLVGSGPLSPVLMGLTKKLGLEHAVVFTGWAAYSDLPAYYSRSRAVVLPSVSEPWGLVVNEAMAAGKAVLVSSQCGCVPELVRRGVNGYTFDPLNVRELSSLLLRVSSADCDLAALGRNGAKMIQAFTLETRALAIRDCVETMIEARPRHRQGPS